MCVIVVKEKNEQFPKWEDLRKCWNRNCHGAGIMFAHDNEVYIYKGFMSWGNFYKSVEELRKKYSLNEKSVVFHFRIATSGSKDSHTCHPYPLTKNIEFLKKLQLLTSCGIAHNGVISICDNKDKKLNDTQLFIKDFFYDIYELCNGEINQKMMDIIEKLSNIKSTSKFTILERNGDIKCIGEFYTYNGNKYSNLYWQNVYFSRYYQ